MVKAASPLILVRGGVEQRLHPALNGPGPRSMATYSFRPRGLCRSHAPASKFRAKFEKLFLALPLVARSMDSTIALRASAF